MLCSLHGREPLVLDYVNGKGALLNATQIDTPCDCFTSAPRSIVMISSGVNRFLGIDASLKSVHRMTGVADKFLEGRSRGTYSSRSTVRTTCRSPPPLTQNASGTAPRIADSSVSFCGETSFRIASAPSNWIEKDAWSCCMQPPSRR